MLTLYNTLTRQKMPFQPLLPGKVSMYCCGVTVYDLCHLGHARSYIVWDILRRYLQWQGYQVYYAQNFTDVDDKILNRAKTENTSMDAIANRYIDAYFEDIRQLNIQDASEYPRVTDHITAIHDLIQSLIARGYAYVSAGDVYYNVEQFPDYGKLSGRKLEQLQAGASGRLTGDELKLHPFDFALWKAADPGEPAWDSPWGLGRPGWHIECSAMIRSRLGETIDIHGGGGDLVFPHHENEIAQSEAITGRSLANYWLHNGMVTVNGEKMSKSLGNFTTIRDLLTRVHPMVIRLFVLQSHYRKPLDFTESAIASAQQSWNTLQEGISFGYTNSDRLAWQTNASRVQPAIDAFQTAMNDDLNTAAALAVLFDLAKPLSRAGNRWRHEGNPPDTAHLQQQWQEQWQTLVELAQVLGFCVTPTAPAPAESDIAEIERLIQQRQQARQAKDFAESDRIRDELNAMGITVVDQPNGETQWYASVRG
jgi:cysteinyl-tRNA synthetase